MIDVNPIIEVIWLEISQYANGLENHTTQRQTCSGELEFRSMIDANASNQRLSGTLGLPDGNNSGTDASSLR